MAYATRPIPTNPSEAGSALMNLHLDLEAQRSEPDYVVYKPGAAGSLPADRHRRLSQHDPPRRHNDVLWHPERKLFLPGKK